MKKILQLIAIILAFNTVQAQNLVQNPGFETATVGLPGGTTLPFYPTLLNNWSAVNTDGEFIYDLTLAHTGTGFLSVLQNAGANPGTFWLGATGAGSGYDRAIQVVPVLPSTVYQLKFWVRSGDGMRYSGYGSGYLLVQVEQSSPSNIAIDSLSVYTPLTWQQSIINFTTGSTCTSVALLFSCYSANPVDAWVDDIELRTETTGVNTVAGTSVLLYPNPVSDKLNITLDNNETSELILYDGVSKIILHHTFTGLTTINTSNLARGMYFYEVRNKNGVINTGKLVKE